MKLWQVAIATPLLCVLALSARDARAQYVCAPGTYSVLGSLEVPNASYCAPMEDYGDDAHAKTDDGPPPPEPVWEDRWGAIATGEGSFGTALNYASESDARTRAIFECQVQGNGSPCRVRLTFYNQCASLASGDAGSIAYSAATEEQAKESAVARCADHTANCHVTYSGCSLPELVN